MKRSISKMISGPLLAAAVFCFAIFAVQHGRRSWSQTADATAQPITAETQTGSENDPDEDEEPPYTPKSKAQLKRDLTAIQYKVTQMEETEPAFRNRYWDNKKEGLYRCIVCDQSLFSSETKYKSGTGWPSFYDPIKNENVGYKSDFHLFYPRQEVHCSRCKAHLGHVFNDGPRNKTGKRYCMNSAALRFEPESKKDASAGKSGGTSRELTSQAK